MLRNKLYYCIKPFVPPRLRLAIRVRMARRVRDKFSAIWPILPGSERPPKDWPGWPQGKLFAFVLTHDVEGPSGVAKCRQLMELEKKYGFRSSFNFIPEGAYRVTRELRDELAREGFEVGVHDLRHDGKLYSNRYGFAENAARINGYLKEWGAVGFRSGFMLHNLEWLQDLDIKYDASTFDTDPFEPQPDGTGTIFPFWKEGSKGRGYVEMPYTLPQDSTLYLVLGEATPAIWQQKADWVAEHGGMVLLNLHPDYLAFPGEPPHFRTFPVGIYEQFLKHMRDKHASTVWHVLPRELAAWHGRRSTTPPRLAQKRDSISALKISGGKNRMATVLFANYLDDARVRRETEALASAGLVPDVIALRRDKSQPSVETVNGVTIHRVRIKQRRDAKLTYVFQYGWFFVNTFARLSFWSLKHRYRVVHVHNMPDFLVFTALVPKMLGARILLDLHDPMPELYCSIYGKSPRSFPVRALKFVEKWAIAFADQVITPNLSFKTVFCERAGNPGKIDIVMNSPDPALFGGPRPEAGSGQQSGKRPFCIMFHGTLVERHGLDLAVDALARLRGRIPDVVLNLYGARTPYVDSILRQIDELKMQDVVHYRGRKTLEEIARLLRDIDLGLIPNRLNQFTAINFPTRIFECLATWKPVLVPRTQGILDYFSEDSMLFFEPGNVQDLAGKIEWACTHPAELAAVMEKGRAVFERHHWSVQRDRMMSVVQNLLDGDQKAAPSPAATIPQLNDMDQAAAARRKN